MSSVTKSARPPKPKSTRKGSQRARRRAPRKQSSGQSATELVSSLLHREAESVELLQGIVLEPGIDSLRPGLLQCLRLHECCVLRLSSLLAPHPPISVDETDPEMRATSDEVMVVTDDDILQDSFDASDDIVITLDDPYRGGPAFRSVPVR